MFKGTFFLVITSLTVMGTLVATGCDGKYPPQDTPENAVKAAMQAAASLDFPAFQRMLGATGLARAQFTSQESMNQLVTHVKSKLHGDFHIEDRGLVEVASNQNAVCANGACAYTDREDSLVLATHRFDVVADDSKARLFQALVTCSSDVARETHCVVDDIALEGKAPGENVAQQTASE